MEDLKKVFGTLADGLKSIASGIEVLAEKINDLSATKTPAKKKPAKKSKPAAKVKAKPKAAAKKKAKPAKKTVAKKAAKKPAKKTAKKPSKKAAPKATAKPAAKKQEGPSSIANMLALIQKSGGSITTATLLEKTGYNQKKLSNILYKLKKQGKIKSEKRGVYSAS
ncbi:MAG: hypothetical protein JRH15_03630 [Deltaproteobacteria bacterium]|nr:hypothetical protein [Deltaproteobacteria bacterium]